jgi:pyrimidine-nucleoside phosphorylase
MLQDGSALRIFREMVAAQGGDVKAIDAGIEFHQPRFRREFRAARGGYFVAADCTKVGWAVQRLGAGREKAGEPVEAHAGLEMHVKLGARVEAGQVLATLFAQEEARLAEPEHLLAEALTIGDAPKDPPPLVRDIISADNKDSYLKAGNHP